MASLFISTIVPAKGVLIEKIVLEASITTIVSFF